MENLDNGFKDKKTVSEMPVFSERGTLSRKYMHQKKGKESFMMTSTGLTEIYFNLLSLN